VHVVFVAGEDNDSLRPGGGTAVGGDELPMLEARSARGAPTPEQRGHHAAHGEEAAGAGDAGGVAVRVGDEQARVAKARMRSVVVSPP
jgi:hypothetical protein